MDFVFQKEKRGGGGYKGGATYRMFGEEVARGGCSDKVVRPRGTQDDASAPGIAITTNKML